jgi:hypothetical protein
MRAGDYREILALIHGLSGRIEAVQDQTQEIHKDAREARDAVTKLTERVGAQDTPARLAELSGKVERGFIEARSDLVNTADKLTREMRGDFEILEKRLAALEQWKQRMDGATGLMGWISKNAPWLVGFALAAAAWVFKDKLPG